MVEETLVSEMPGKDFITAGTNILLDSFINLEYDSGKPLL